MIDFVHPAVDIHMTNLRHNVVCILGFPLHEGITFIFYYFHLIGPFIQYDEHMCSYGGKWMEEIEHHIKENMQKSFL